MQRPILLLAFFTCSTGVVPAQTTRLTVVADGLHLRASPSAAAPSIAVMPFGAAVFAQTDSIRAVMERDTGNIVAHPVASFKQEWKRGASAKGILVRDTAFLLGQWWKVQYGTLYGYAFSAFLYDDTVAVCRNDSMELISEIGDRKVFWQPDWHWYGLFERNGDAFLNKIEPFWIVEWSLAEMTGYPRLITDSPERALFVVTSALPLPIERYKGDWGNPMGGFEPAVLQRDTGLVPNRRLLRNTKLAVELSETGKEIRKVFSLTKKGKKQQLLPWEENPDYRADNLFVAWYGDLDGDGLRDFVLGVPEYEAHITRFSLFTSKGANKGLHLKMVSGCALMDGMDLE